MIIKHPIIVYEVIVAIACMDIPLINFLLTEPDYNGQPKAEFLQDLSALFDHLKANGDEGLKPIIGRCLKMDADRLPMTFIGLKSSDYFHLVFDMDEDYLLDLQSETVLAPAQSSKLRNLLPLNDKPTDEIMQWLSGMEPRDQRIAAKRKKSLKKLPRRYRDKPYRIERLYPYYCQKSAVFLYPLLHLKGHPCVQPLCTYLTDGDKTPLEEPSLLVLYKQDDTEQWRQFEYSSLENSVELQSMQELEDNLLLCKFDLSFDKADYAHFLQGRYSDFSKRAKAILMRDFNYAYSAMQYVSSYLYPESYYSIYANILDIDEALLREAGELCAKYDLHRETLDISSKDWIQKANLNITDDAFFTGWDGNWVPSN